MSRSFPFTRRSRMDVLAGMLEAASKKGGLTKTQIRGNLTCKQSEKYLKFLIRKDLLKVQKLGSKMLFSITDKGINYLRGYRELKKMLFT